MCIVGDFSFGRLPKYEQLLVIHVVMRILRMMALGACNVGPLYPKGGHRGAIAMLGSGKGNVWILPSRT